MEIGYFLMKVCQLRVDLKVAGNNYQKVNKVFKEFTNDIIAKMINSKQNNLPYPNEWICDICGKEGYVHRCLDKGHEYFCWKCWMKELGF